MMTCAGVMPIARWSGYQSGGLVRSVRVSGCCASLSQSLITLSGR